MHHGVEGMKWGKRRYQNEDGSLTPEGRVHYGYNEYGQQSRAGKKFQKYTEKEHARYDKFQNKRAKSFDRAINKATKKWLKNQNDETRSKLVKALQNKIEDEEIGKYMHNKIDQLTIENYKDDKKIGRGGAAMMTLVGGIGGAAYAGAKTKEAFNKGALGNHGGIIDIEKYNERMTPEAYADISKKARERAIKEFYKEEPRYMNNQRTYGEYEQKQEYLKNNSNALIKEIQKDNVNISKPAKPGVPYWDAYSEGTNEYTKAQRQAETAEKSVFRAEDAYSAALDKYGKDNPITEAARKKYSKAVSSFEANYGYTPQEFD